MKILWLWVTLLGIIYESENQVVRQQYFSNSGNVLPYSYYFNVYQSQSVTVSFSTRCPNLRIMFASSSGSIFYNYGVGWWRNDGWTYTFNVNIGSGNSQSIVLIDWNNNRMCSWSYSFQLNFNCSIVTSQCYDCSSYTTCTNCVGGYFLYMNRCYTNIPNCATRSGLSCALCSSGYILVDGACRLCSSFMPNCQTCPNPLTCSTCMTKYALDSGNTGCTKCSIYILNCVYCSSRTVCTSCLSKYALANALTCQLCTVTLPNCIYCSSTSQCTGCVVGYAIASDGTCQSCSSFILNCLQCGGSSSCTRCDVGYALSPSVCTACSFSMSGCKQCSATDCLSCYDGYWLNAGTCDPCSGTLSNCLSCSDDLLCNSCAIGYGLTSVSVVATRNTRSCSLCSSTMSQCMTCSDLSNCYSCNPQFTIYSYRCYSCSYWMSYCLECTDTITCTACIDNRFALNSGNYCQHCSFYMDQCVTCSDRSTCITCASGTVLKDARCRPCSVVMPYCRTCTTQITCTSCQLTYQLDPISGTCKPCEYFIANCSVCSSTTFCTFCLPGTILAAGKCQTCDYVFPKCINCVSNVSCAICDQGSVVFKGYCEACSTFINHCANCIDTFYCQECEDPYITNNVKKCVCKPPLYNVSDYCVPDKNCVSAYKQDGLIYCSFCNIAALFYLDTNDKCVCKKGYKQINDQCVQFCGDGQLVSHQCDDNNTIDGDGCSSQCKIQASFVCVQLLSGVSYCRFKSKIQLQYNYVFKMLYENKGQITISLLSSHPNILKFFRSDNFKYSLFHNRSDSINITGWTKNNQDQIIIDIDYNETIQDTFIELRFQFSKQKILSQDNYLKFKLKGSNYPLVISKMTDDYKMNSNITKYIVMIGYGVAMLLLFSDKFIVVEGVNTLQLTFFSLLLIYESAKWPQAIVAIKPLKYSTGYNQLIFQPNAYDNINNNAFKKFQYIDICSYFLPNNLINSIVLFIAFTIFLIVFYIKTKPQNALFSLKDGPKKKKMSKQLQKIRKIFKIIYNITFNFSYIMILQVIVSLYVQFSFAKSISVQMKSINKLVSVMTLSIIIITILQTFIHFFLSVKDTYSQNFKVGSRQIKYRRVYFIYILFNTLCIFLFNDKKIFNFTMSFYLLIAAIFYLLFLVIYRPYKQSFLIHGLTVIFNHVMYLLALLMINAINFNIQLSEVYFLVFSYLVMSFSLVVFVLMIIRVFYQFKYGEEQMQHQIELQIKGQKQQQNQFLLNKTAQIQQKNNQSMKKNSQNSYLYQNQKLQAQKIQFLNQLKKKSFLSEWQKDQAYFRIYDRKPIGWVHQNQTEEKYKILLQKEKQRFQRDTERQQMIKIKNQKLLSKNYIDQMHKIKQKLRNQHSIKQHKKIQKKEQKKTKKDPNKKDQNKSKSNKDKDKI